MASSVYWDVTSCSTLKVSRRFGITSSPTSRSNKPNKIPLVAMKSSTYWDIMSCSFWKSMTFRRYMHSLSSKSKNKPRKTSVKQTTVHLLFQRQDSLSASHIEREQESYVNIVTRLLAWWPWNGDRFPTAPDVFPQRPGHIWVHPSSCPSDTEVHSPRIKQTGCGIDHCSPATAKFMAWSNASSPPYVLMSWCLMKHKGDFAFKSTFLTSEQRIHMQYVSVCHCVQCWTASVV
jgi:hypothetical protein